MTILEKLSDRNNFIYEAIKLVLVNKGNLSAKQLQWELFQCGVYVKGPLLKQALSVMDEKGLLSKPKEAETKEEPKSKIITDATFQKEG